MNPIYSPLSVSLSLSLLLSYIHTHIYISRSLSLSLSLEYLFLRIHITIISTVYTIYYLDISGQYEKYPFFLCTLRQNIACVYSQEYLNITTGNIRKRGMGHLFANTKTFCLHQMSLRTRDFKISQKCVDILFYVD